MENEASGEPLQLEPIPPLAVESVPLREFRVWYRHSGHPEIPEGMAYNMKKVKDYRAILRNIRSHHITHMYIDFTDVVPPLDIICPRITHLRIFNVKPGNTLDCLANLNELYKLEICYAEFRNGMPEVLSKLKTLEVLSMTDCNIGSLPPSFNALKNLKILYLSGDELTFGYPAVVSELFTLQELSLPWFNIKEIPQSLSELKLLQILDVTKSDFVNGLPLVICELTELKSLAVALCNLSDLPQSFHRLHKLEYLSLATNNLTILPPPVFRLFKLKTLYIQDNSQLHTIDRAIMNLTELEELCFDNCPALLSPPAELWDRGLEGVQEYFTQRG